MISCSRILTSDKLLRNIDSSITFKKSIQQTQFTLVTCVRVSSSHLLSSIFEALTKNLENTVSRRHTKTGQTSPFLGVTKTSNLPNVVWAEESKNCIRFEIGPSYDDVPTRFQLVTELVTDGQSSCI